MILTEHNVPFAEPGARLRSATWLKDRLFHAVVAYPPGTPSNVGPGLLNREISRESPLSPRHRRLRHRDRERLCLAYDKGADDLVRAFAMVRLEAPCDLLVVGDGPHRERLHAVDASAKGTAIPEQLRAARLDTW